MLIITMISSIISFPKRVTCAILVKVQSLVRNLLYLMMQVLENLADKLNVFSTPFDSLRVCAAAPPPPTRNGYCTRSKRRKSVNSQQNGHSEYYGGNEVKRIKLLLDITVSEKDSRVLDIKAQAQPQQNGYVVNNGSQCESCGEEKKGVSDVSFIWKVLNIPSTVLFYSASVIRQWAVVVDDDQTACENLEACNDAHRVKKSPKRRIPRANYRKILPFFPFNLLGFSNYSAFQMPTITTTECQEGCNLNASVNGKGKARCKRRRHSSTEEDLQSLSSISDDSNLASGSKAPQQAAGGGVDEVDSDETADTVTKQISSSSSSTNGLPYANGYSKQFVIVSEAEVCNNSSQVEVEPDTCELPKEDEVHVVSTFMQELNEATKEYQSDEDPDYKPSESTTDESSFMTDSAASEDSFLNCADVIDAALAAEQVSHSFTAPSVRKSSAPEPPLSTVEEEFKTPDESQDERPSEF